MEEELPPISLGSEDGVSKLGKTHFTENKCSLSRLRSLRVSVNTGGSSFEAHTQIVSISHDLSLRVEFLASQP